MAMVKGTYIPEGPVRGLEWMYMDEVYDIIGDADDEERKLTADEIKMIGIKKANIAYWGECPDTGRQENGSMLEEIDQLVKQYS